MTKTIPALRLANPVNTLLAGMIFPLWDGSASGGTLIESIRAFALDDASVAAVPTVAGHTASIASLTSSVNGLSTQSTLIARKPSNTATVNSTSTNSDLWAADTTRAFVGDDALVYLALYELINTSGSNAGFSFLTKINGTNSINPGTLTLASSAASTSYQLGIAHVLAAGASSTAHVKTATLQIRPATTRSATTTMGFGYAVDPTNSNPLDLSQFIQATSFDITSTIPSWEVRITPGVANAGVSVQRIMSEMFIVKDH